MFRRMSWVLLSTVGLVVLVGCAENKLTRHNYDMIKEGQSTRSEVRHTLGVKHLAERGDQWEYEDLDRHLSVVFYFDNNGVVRRKEWIDAGTGEWEGAAPHIDKNPQGEKMSERTSTTTIKND